MSGILGDKAFAQFASHINDQTMIASDATLDRFLAARMAFIVRCDWLITSHKPRQRDAVGAPSCTRIAHDLAPNEMEQDGLIGIGDVGGGASSSLGRCLLPWAERVQRVGRGRGRKLRRRRCGTAGGAEWNEIEGQRSAKLGERAESRQGLPTLGCRVAEAEVDSQPSFPQMRNQ